MNPKIHEHKLTPLQSQYVKELQQKLKSNRTEYLMALGRATELRLEGESMQTALNQHLDTIVTGLPESKNGYTLKADGETMVGELIDEEKKELPPPQSNEQPLKPPSTPQANGQPPVPITRPQRTAAQK